VSELRFEWDDAKAAKKNRNHGVTFDEATTVFDDPYVLLRDDIEHSDDEDRIQAIGMSHRLRVLFVVFVELKEDLFRIVSARRATLAERQSYEKRKAKAQER
jgi:uncharacterized protein